MTFYRSACIAGILSLGFLVGVAHAQNSGGQLSPFGKATPQQQQVASQAENAQLSALAAWQKLPAKQQTDLTAQMATMSQAQRLALLKTVPGLKGLSAEQYQVLLTQIAVTTPYPSLFNIQPQDVHALHGQPVQLRAYMGETLLTSGVTWPRTASGSYWNPAEPGVVASSYAFGWKGDVFAEHVESGARASTFVTFHVAEIKLSADSAQLSRTNAVTLTAEVLMDGRVPHGSPEGYVKFNAGSFNGDPLPALCQATLAPLPDDGSGFKRSAGSCVADTSQLPAEMTGVTVSGEFRGQESYRNNLNHPAKNGATVFPIVP